MNSFKTAGNYIVNSDSEWGEFYVNGIKYDTRREILPLYNNGKISVYRNGYMRYNHYKGGKHGSLYVEYEHSLTTHEGVKVLEYFTPYMKDIKIPTRG